MREIEQGERRQEVNDQFRSGSGSPFGTVNANIGPCSFAPWNATTPFSIDARFGHESRRVELPTSLTENTIDLDFQDSAIHRKRALREHVDDHGLDGLDALFGDDARKCPQRARACAVTDRALLLLEQLQNSERVGDRLAGPFAISYVRSPIL